MSATLNKVMLMGNLTRDPDLRQSPNGDTVAEMGIAVSEQFRSRATGETREVVTFVDVTVWGQVAENCGRYLTKGRPVFVEGRLVLDTWTDKTTGKQRSRLRVRADRVQFLYAPDRANGAKTAPRVQGGTETPANATEGHSVARSGQIAPSAQPSTAEPAEELPF